MAGTRQKKKAEKADTAAAEVNAEPAVGTVPAASIEPLATTTPASTTNGATTGAAPPSAVPLGKEDKSEFESIIALELGAPEANPPRYQILPGRPHPLGAVPDPQGVNFSVFSEHATSIELLLFDEHNHPEPVQVITLDANINRTFVFWHVYVQGLRPGSHYAYRVDGPMDPSARGHRFSRDKVLTDPYGRGHTNTLWNRGIAASPEDNLASSMRSVVIDISGYDWEGDQPLNRPTSNTVIYEVHPAGFTRSPTSGCQNRGTFTAMIEKIPYLTDLGITAVEVLNDYDFDDKEGTRPNPIDGSPLTNYWGYSPFGFFAPHAAYCVSPEEGSHIKEFRDMVKAFHKAGIEIILDVVFNHTDEGDHRGPTINLRGFDNSVFYILSHEDRQYYMNYSGCGNTLNTNHPVVEKFIVDSLEYWVREMHVDGFRFDEGSILCRADDGSVMERPPVIWQIELSETLADTKVIAECWDAGGCYQVGYFPGFRWAEWNGRYRDDIRRFVKGDAGLVGRVASSLAGSADMYQMHGHLPVNSINFVTCHDGFCLNDLVSYNSKHNEANGEGNRDGHDDNISWNCGVEGPTDDPWVETFRERQIKNFATILLVSQGVPMILSGDEVRRSQKGNNNAYCQDNELSWFDWTLVEMNAGLLRFYQQMIRLRLTHHVLHRRHFISGQMMNSRGVSIMSWHGCQLNSPGWFDSGCRVLALTLGDRMDEADIHIMMNMDGQDLDFEVPPIQRRMWFRVVDTAMPSPEDILEPGSETPAFGRLYNVKSHSIAVLISKDCEEQARLDERGAL